VQHLEYIPFGEVFIDERPSAGSWSTPYKFNGKELDEETGLYYYWARYYDPRTSLWISVDPLAEKHPEISSYVYCAGNPINLIDPDGRDWTEKNGKISWNEKVTSAKDKDLVKGEKYLGRNVLVGTHNRDANLKEPINSAKFELYLENNKEGVTATIYGNTIPSDDKKAGILAEGLYKVISGHRNKEKYKNELALRIYNLNGTDGLPTVNGNPNKKSDGKTLTGILFHIGNQHQESLSDSNGNPYSTGCQTSHNGSDANGRHKLFFSPIGRHFNGIYYLRKKK